MNVLFTSTAEYRIVGIPRITKADVQYFCVPRVDARKSSHLSHHQCSTWSRHNLCFLVLASKHFIFSIATPALSRSSGTLDLEKIDDSCIITYHPTSVSYVLISCTRSVRSSCTVKLASSQRSKLPFESLGIALFGQHCSLASSCQMPCNFHR